MWTPGRLPISLTWADPGSSAVSEPVRLWRLLPEVLRGFYSLHTQNNKILSKMSTNVHALVYTILLRYMSLNKVLIATAQMRTCCVASTNRLPHNTPRTWSFYITLLRTHSPTSYGRLVQESQALLLAIIYLTSPFNSFTAGGDSSRIVRRAREATLVEFQYTFFVFLWFYEFFKILPNFQQSQYVKHNEFIRKFRFSSPNW